MPACYLLHAHARIGLDWCNNRLYQLALLHTLIYYYKLSPHRTGRTTFYTIKSTSSYENTQSMMYHHAHIFTCTPLLCIEFVVGV